MRTLWDESKPVARGVIEAGVKANDVDLPAFRKAAAPIHERYLADRDRRDLYRGIRALV